MGREFSTRKSSSAITLSDFQWLEFRFLKFHTIKYLLIFFALIFIFLIPASAVEDQDILYPTIGGKKEIGTGEPIKKEDEGFDLNLSCSALFGYDTNVYLDHYDPAASLFTQEAFGAKTKTKLFDLCVLRCGYDITSIKYFRFSEPDFLDNILSAGLDAEIADNILWSADYAVDFVGYPHDKAVEYSMNEFSTGLRHDITNSLYQKIIYKISHKHYPKWKTRNNDGFVRMGDRTDTRNTFEHQFGWYANEKTFLEADNSIYFNDSNEVFLDYYDYTVFKTGCTVLHAITDKLYGLANAGYQHKIYRKRAVSDQDREDQRDRLLMCGTSLFYDVASGVSIGLNFDYRKNFSNEGIQKYQDFIISSGLYWSY